MQEEQTSGEVSASDIVNRRQALKLAAGAGALGSVLGFSADGAQAAATSQDRLQIKVEWYAGRDRSLGSVSLPAEVTEFISKGDLTQVKVTWLAQRADQKEPTRVAQHGLEPQAIEGLKKLQEEMR